MLAIVMNPINSLIPLTMEMYKKAGIYEYNRIFGVMNFECLKANSFTADLINIEPECTMIPVIGGGCSETCIPLFSQAKPSNKISQVIDKQTFVKLFCLSCQIINNNRPVH